MFKTVVKYRIFIITMAVVSALILALFYNILKPQRVLPIYQPAQVNAALVDTAIQYKKKIP